MDCETIKITMLANRGVKKSIERAKRKGIPNPFVIDGTLVFKMPDGSIQTAWPKGWKVAKKQ